MGAPVRRRGPPAEKASNATGIAAAMEIRVRFVTLILDAVTPKR
jgi:hypothetical protein